MLTKHFTEVVNKLTLERIVTISESKKITLVSINTLFFNDTDLTDDKTECFELDLSGVPINDSKDHIWNNLPEEITNWVLLYIV